MPKDNPKKYVVTGGAGFIGSHLVDALVARGDKVAIVDDLSSGLRANINPQATFYEADIRDAAALGKILSEFPPDGIFHMAAIVSVQFSIEHPEDTFEVNVTGIKNIFNAAKKARIVFSSSSAVYGDVISGDVPAAVSETAPLNPKSPYGMHKKMGEQYADISLRYFNVYGPRQRGDSSYAGVIARFLEMTRQNKSLSIFGDGSQTRDFVHVSDVVAANILAMENTNISGEAINIGSGKATSVKEIAEIFGGDSVESGVAIEYMPPRIEPKNSLADISKAQKTLKWSPKMLLSKGIALLRDMH
jgi:UDP-glucose 4-epimerase